MEEIAHKPDDVITQNQVLQHPFAPQVEIAEFKADILIDIGIFIDIKRCVLEVFRI